MDRFRRYGALLKADGTNQLQRMPPALEQGYILPDERSLSDLLAYAQAVAAEVRFYNLTGQSTGDWRPFLEPFVDLASGRIRSTTDLATALATRRDWPPHVALFLVFLELFRYLQDDLNELPRRHLAYYYERELGLVRRPAVADDVHVIFELARNAAATPLEKDTALDAGKDAEGQPLTYKTQGELVVSPAQVAEVRRLVVETDRRGRRRFFAADAVSEVEGDSWHTFGRRQLDLDPSQRFMAEARLGFAIASPILRMAEGQRTLSVTAHLRAASGPLPPAQVLTFGLEAALTGEEGWVTPDAFDARLVDPGLGGGPFTLQITVTLNEGAGPIVPFDAALHGDGPVSDWPVLRCLLKTDSGYYETLDRLIVERADLSVSVRGVRDLVVQNDQGPLTPDQPMALFGTQPRIGSHFYVGSAEAFGKRLSSLTLNLAWQDPPENLYDHYQAYFDFVDSGLTGGFRSLFVAEVDLLYDRTWNHRLLGNQTLFAPAVTDARTITATPGAFDSAFGTRTYQADPSLIELTGYTAGTRSGFVRLTLRGPTRDDLQNAFGVPYATKVPFEAFGHQAFPRRYASQAVALARWDGTGTEPALPAEPYTPTLASLSLDYTADLEMVPGDTHADEAFFTLGPWGYTAADAEVSARLVPTFDGEAALYLGVKDLSPPANLSLLFQIDRGTATSTEVLDTGDTGWSYLAGGTWKALAPEAVLNDATYGFQQPGLVVLSVGREATTMHTAMPSGLVWLRAHIDRPPESACRTLALHAQAALATLAPDTGAIEDYTKHLVSGLAAETIKRLRTRSAAIKQVSQPYASFGGRSGEADEAFFRRSSERLRHRNRAVTGWDFERLVLESFPEVFKVKCLPHSDAMGNPGAGEAALVILPDLRSTESTNPLEPRAGAVLMGQIEDYVRTGLTSPFATVHVIHPEYERIRVDARVAFRSGLDAGYYASVLNEDLRRFLSPWAYEEGQDILFGARIYKSDILAFMEGRDYVDYITDFDLYHTYDGPPRGGIGQLQIGVDFVIRPDPSPAVLEMTIGEDFIVGRGVEVAETTRAQAILVSHQAHRLTAVTAGETRCTGVDRLGIGYMTVGLDFDVHAA